MGEFWNGDSAERICAAAGERSEANHEEVETWERDHVDSEFSKIRVELAWESEAGCDTRHDCGDEVVEITVGGVGELEGAHADIVKSLSKLARCMIAVKFVLTSLSMQKVSSEFSTS